MSQQFEDHTDAFDYGEHQQYFGQGQGMGEGGMPESESDLPPPPPFKGGSDWASLCLAAVILGCITAGIWLPPLMRMIRAPRRWWRDQDVKREWLSRWTVLKLIPLVLLLVCVYNLAQYVEEDPDVVNYRYFGLAPGAPESEVKKSWRKLARVKHPDVMKNPTPEDRQYFERAQAAYTAIMNPEQNKEEREREKLWKEMEEYGESIALPSFMLDKENKKWVMLTAIMGVLLPLAYCLFLLQSGWLEDEVDDSVPRRKISKRKQRELAQQQKK